MDDVSEAVAPVLVLVGVIIAKGVRFVGCRGVEDGVVGAQAVEGLSVGSGSRRIDADRHIQVVGELTRDSQQHGLRCFPAISYLVSSLFPSLGLR